MSHVVSLPACDSPSDPWLPRRHVLHVLLRVSLPPGSGKWGRTVEKPGPVMTQGQGREDSWSLWVSGCVWRRGTFQPAASLRDCRHWGVSLGGHIFLPPVCTQAERSSFEAGCFGCKGSKLGSRVCVSGSTVISTGLRGDSKISSLCCLKLNPDFKKKLFLVVLGLRCSLQGLPLAVDQGSRARRLSCCGTWSSLPCRMWGLSSPTGARTHGPCSKAQSLNWTTREVQSALYDEGLQCSV